MAKKLTRAQDPNLARALAKFDEVVNGAIPGDDLTLIGHLPTSVDIENLNNDIVVDNIEENISATEILITELYSAPKKWNLWQPLSKERMIELMESLYHVGLLHNIVVWKVPPGISDELTDRSGYMILSGHNRIEALKRLYSHFNEAKFLKVRALVYEADEINLAIARRIIDDANLVQRENSPKEIAQAYMRRMKSLKSLDEYKQVSDRTLMEIMADDEGTSRTKILAYIKLNDCLDPIVDLVGTVINLKAGVKIAQLPINKQEYLYNTYYLQEKNRPLFVSSNLMKLTPLHTTESIDRIMSVKEEDFIKVEYNIPSHLASDVDQLIREFLKVNFID